MAQISKFPWGRPIENIGVGLDGNFFEYVKYHPWKQDLKHSTLCQGEVDETQVLYHVKELSESFLSLDTALIAWIARRNLGLNQSPLVQGIARALNTPEYAAREEAR